MGATQFVHFGERGFWAYDTVLGVFLKYLIDVPRQRGIHVLPSSITPYRIGAWRLSQISASILRNHGGHRSGRMS